MKLFRLSFILLLSFFSCATYNHKDPYPNMEVLHYDNYTAYEFRDFASDKLIVIFDGSSYSSSLGFFNGKKWSSVSIASQFVPLLRDEYTILVPEKLNRIVGKDHFDDMDDRSNYYSDKLIDCYKIILNAYLDGKNYSSIILIGISESAILLPLIYENIIKKELVKGMVSIVGGGLSLYENMEILSTSQTTPNNWKNGYLDMIRLYQENDLKYPDSITDGFNGMSFRWYNSFMNIRPYEYYKKINFPILFVHGRKDYRIPIESTEYIENNLPEKPFNYLYYQNMEHSPNTYSQILRLREDIVKWIKDKKL